MTLAETLALSGLTGIVDACDLRNASAAPVTMNGRIGAISGTLNSGADGVVLDGTYATFAGLPDMRPFTVIADITGASPIAGWGGIIYVTAVSGANFGGGQAITHNGSGAQFFGRDGSALSLLTGDLGTSGSALGIHGTDPTAKVIGFSYDHANKPCVSAWADGKHVASAATSTVWADNPLTQLTFGAKHNAAGSFSDFHRCTLRSFVVLNRVASPAEHVAAANALMRLDRRAENLLILGDSMSAQVSSSPQDNWPLQLSRSFAAGGRYRFLNHAVNGSPAGSGAAHWRLRAEGYTAPTTMIVFCGTAGVLLGIPAVDEWAAIKYLLRQARSAGYRTVLCKIPPGQPGGFTAPQEAQRVALNALFVANAHEADSLADFDAAIAPFTGDPTFWTDLVHLNGKGKAVVAKLIAGGGL